MISGINSHIVKTHISVSESVGSQRVSDYQFKKYIPNVNSQPNCGNTIRKSLRNFQSGNHNKIAPAPAVHTELFEGVQVLSFWSGWRLLMWRTLAPVKMTMLQHFI